MLICFDFELNRDTFSPTRIPTLDEFVDECLELDLNMMIDLKTWRRPGRTADLVCGLFRARPSLYSKALVTTFFPHLAYLIRMRDPKIVTAMAWRPHFVSYDSWNGESDLKAGRTLKSHCVNVS